MSVHKLTEHLLPGEADAELVEALESLVDRAKRGEIKAVAWAGVTGNDHLVTGWDGAGGTVFSLGSAVMCLQSRFADFIMEDDE